MCEQTLSSEMQLNKLVYRVTVVFTVNMHMVLLETWIFKIVETILMIKKAFLNDSVVVG